MKCPICSAELSAPSYKVAENKKLIYRCQKCDDFWNHLVAPSVDIYVDGLTGKRLSQNVV